MTAIINIKQNEAEQYSLNFLKENQVYYILCIEDGWFRILNEEREPALYDSKYFKIVDNQINSDWIIKMGLDEGDNTGYCSYLGPKEFSEQCFFEKFYDKKNDTVDIFLKYLNSNPQCNTYYSTKK